MSLQVLLVLVLPLVLGLPGTLLSSLAAPAVRRDAAMAGALLGVLAALASLASIGPEVLAGASPGWHVAWIPAAGIDVSLRVDGLAFLFASLILGIGALIVVYARFYLGDGDPIVRFYATLLVFMFAMLGIALSDNLVVLVVFWELTSLSSFFLIGYWNREADSRRSARVALAVTGGGGLALVAGVLLIGHIGGGYAVSELVARRDVIVSHPLYPPALVLILLGAFTKSAQFPFHFWLPAAMAAPTPVSAYLHSATMVKAGLLLVARLSPVIGGTELFTLLVAGTGLTTMVFAAATAMFKHDLKGLLAYSTVSHLGLIMFLLGLGTPAAAVAGVFHLLNHAAFKAALFMSAGIIDHEAGTRDIRRLGGIWRYMPLTTLLAGVAAAAMAGVPPFNGFISKEMFLEQVLAMPGDGLFARLAPGIATLGAAFSVAYSVRYIHDTFFNGAPRAMPNEPHDPGPGMLAPVALLVLACIALGLAPAYLAQPIVSAAAAAIGGVPTAPPEVHLALWHGFGGPLAMSAIALVGGSVLYATLLFGFRLHTRNDDLISARRAFDRVLERLILRAARASAAIDRGSLQRSLVLMLAAMVAASVVVTARLAGAGFPGVVPGSRPTLAADLLAWVVWLMAVGGAVAAVAWRRDHVKSMLAAAVVGLAVALAFARFSAPDLALTQISVEVVSTLLLFMGLSLLPRGSEPGRAHPARHLAHGLVALACGVGVGWLALAAMTRDADSIAWYFVERSLSQGGGRNVVNVILVDFRGFDTLGEITVLALAALGVYALLGGLKVAREPSSPGGLVWAADVHPLMLRVVAGWMLPLTLVVALHVFLRGHNAPGGGFIAGLVVSVALLMQYMAHGIDRVDSILAVRYDRVLGAGLLIAAATGVGSFVWEHPFLTSHTAHPTLAVFGEVGLASAAVFDLGVMLVVVGATLLTVLTLGRVGTAAPTAPPQAAPTVPAGLAREVD